MRVMKVKNSFINGSKVKDEAGVAMITVIVLGAVLMVIAGGMYFMAAREQTMTRAENVGGQAFYYAEGGIENALDILNYAATETQMTRLRADQSSDGQGYLMDPEPSLRENPPNPIQMNLGGQTYKVWADLRDDYWEHCPSSCGLRFASPQRTYANLLVTAEGWSGEGYRKMQQRVRLEATDFPLYMYIDGPVDMGGTHEVNNQNLFVKGDFCGRGKLDIGGSDLVFGGGAGVLATGTIYDKANCTTPIYSSSGLPNPHPDYPDDRDSRGPSTNTPPRFGLAELEETFNTGGLSQDQLNKLRNAAQNRGYYRNTSGGFDIHQDDLYAAPYGHADPEMDDIVVFVEFPAGEPNDNEVRLRFNWPPGKALIVVLNGSIQMSGNDIGNLMGSVYSPDGKITANGGGTGNFTGTVWGKGMRITGNWPFYMTSEFLADPPMVAWEVYRDTRWTLVDR